MKGGGREMQVRNVSLLEVRTIEDKLRSVDSLQRCALKPVICIIQ